MEAISVFLVVMSCSPDALACREDSRPEPFADMAACQAARAEVAGHPQDAPEAGAMILSECRYSLEEEPRGIQAGPVDSVQARHLAW